MKLGMITFMLHLLFFAAGKLNDMKIPLKIRCSGKKSNYFIQSREATYYEHN